MVIVWGETTHIASGRAQARRLVEDNFHDVSGKGSTTRGLRTAAREGKEA